MLRKWLAKIIQVELESFFVRHVNLADNHSATLHQAIAQTSEAIAKFRHTNRAACTQCGRMTSQYAVVTGVNGTRTIACYGCTKAK